MLVAVQHRVLDPEKFFSADAEQVAEGGPSGVKGKVFIGSQEGDTAVCLWEGDSIDDVRAYVDSATEGIAENTYFAVDPERSMNLPAGAPTGA